MVPEDYGPASDRLMRPGRTYLPRDQVVAEVRALIQQYGWGVIHVHGTRGIPALSHTVGFTETLGIPEALVVGTDLETAGVVLNAVGHHVRAMAPAHRALPDGRLHGVIAPPFDLEVRRRGPYAQVGHLETAARYYGHDRFEVVQIFVPDTANRLPGLDAACDPVFVTRQHLPDRAPRPPTASHRTPRGRRGSR